ncbi:protein kinase BUB1 NDAI_0D02140 [Naumovozyma dairenensis CBS 421]|uniref:Protein kinase domain-containing protein n=1 Tax=Naumovozyma dairenensis (strain ATCC 10597 / BCRC 20456 / CBS 421 / NBRC 0211 / NRRL Y-12639) TaxID=1071378 RepID=G0W9R7_NAUDC|nr:hypothetical protein NDAI_0D02140 [Naumovozyma dairenensis CBS 421]CCD24528.1 hypothetical protein NDAI_0D02140 [Naumovozyma dairenensis CBS 421]
MNHTLIPSNQLDTNGNQRDPSTDKNGDYFKMNSIAFQQELNDVKLHFERKLLNELEDMDDPLELFLDYLGALSQLIPENNQFLIELIERSLLYLRDIDTYQNDPRYLQLWHKYIDFLDRQQSVDNLEEIFNVLKYMFSLHIGYKLALFYEYFSTYLFQVDRFIEAHYILEVGIKRRARPLNRLLITLHELESKLRNLNPNFNIELPIQLEFLERFREPSFVTRRSTSSFVENAQKTYLVKQEQLVNRPLQWELYREERGFVPRVNKVVEGKVSRIKSALVIADNVETETKPVKLPIFADSQEKISEVDNEKVYKIIENPGRKPEKIDCNFSLLYLDNQEYAVEEILAMSRNYYFTQKKESFAHNDENIDRSISQPPSHQNKRRRKALGEKRPEMYASQPDVSIAPLSTGNLGGDTNVFNAQGTNPSEYVNITKTSILPLNDSNKINVENENQSVPDNYKVPNSPTVTMVSKNAINEVYSMFNQNYKETDSVADVDDTGKYSLYDNGTHEFTRQNIDDLTEVKNSKPHVTDTAINNNNTTTTATTNNNDTQQTQDYVDDNNTGATTYRSKLSNYMTPIQEKTEHTFQSMNGTQQDSFPRSEPNTTQSSPFLTQPQANHNGMVPNDQMSLLPPPANTISKNEHIIEHPLDLKLRHKLLDSINPPLENYSTYYHYNQSLNMSSLLKKIHKESMNENKNPIVDFKKTGDLYCIRAELGEGGYATVYLAESATGNLRALKVEKPASVWEYYILKQIEDRLNGLNILNSIINANSLHCFTDESYLVLNYANQGTILDLINYQKEKFQNTVDESLCMFITIELIKVLEYVHEIGIIHGDLKPENCMIRFQEGHLGSYNATGLDGWDKKGIYLIDFGRSFDLSLFPSDTKFKADWKTDKQDCYEMQSGKSWTYEADYYGLAGIIHAMLFGSLIDPIQSSNGYFKVKNPLKRYWAKDIWNSAFDVLLNSGTFNEFPLSSTMKSIRQRMEEHLSGSGLGDQLRSIILDLESELSIFKNKTIRGINKSKGKRKPTL